MSLKYYIGLGSNMGNRLVNVQEAILMIHDFARVEEVSSIYLTEPVGMSGCENFLNAAIGVTNGLTPIEMLDALMAVEARMGRVRVHGKTTPDPRPIDLDILLSGDMVIRTERLAIPHPRLSERAFALVPLAEIQPELVHPTLNKTIEELVKELDCSGQSVVRLGELCWAA